MDKKEFAMALKLDREDKGWNQSELARQLGVPPQSVSRWEAAEMFPRDLRLVQICEVFGDDSATAALAKETLQVRRQAREKQGRQQITPLTKKLLDESHQALDKVESREHYDDGVNLTGYYYDRRARMQRELELGIHERPMDLDAARKDALKALHEFELASEHLAEKAAWVRVLAEHLHE